jgi:alcohol dehydrogenase
MRAWSYQRVGDPIQIVEIPEPECAPDGAVVEVRATGVCRSDWHAWRGHDPVPLPMVPGHEFSGKVVAVGEQVTRFGVGDRVTAPFVMGCGRCEFCLAGQAQVCPTQQQPGFTYLGSFADQVAIQRADTNLVRLPDSCDFDMAAALGCRFATAYHALTARARLAAQETAVVIGAGGVGLSTIMIAKALGARVVAVDPSQNALDRAAELGADVTICAADPLPAILEATDGGAHVSVDAVGSAATAERSVRSLRRRGRHVQIGLMLNDNATAGLPWDITVARELEILGSHGMAAIDYPAMLEMITTDRLNPKLLVGQVIDFSGLGPALMAMDRPQGAIGGMTVAVFGSA